MSVSTGQVFQATFEPQEIKKKDHTSASVSATSDPSKSNPLKRFITSPPPSTKSNSNSNSSSEFQHSQQVQPYCLVLTHQEKKKRLRMPKRKADSWPSEILSDPDVLSLDDEGRFVLCKVCHVHYAVHGGKKPKPVIMNSSFRTRAWDVHKERTNSHRIQKKQEEMRQRRYDDDRKEEVGSKTMHSNSGNMETNMHPSQYSSLHQQHQRHHPHNNAIDPSRAQQISNELRSPKRKIFRSNGVLPRPWSENGGNSVHQHRLPQVGAPPNGEHQNQHREQRAPNSEYQHQHQHREQRAPNGEYHHQHQHREQRAPTGEHQHQNQLQRDLRAPSIDDIMRWRDMHDDVSRALSSMRPNSEPYTTSDSTNSQRAQVDPEDFGANTEKAAKKLKSLDEEYEAKNLKRQEMYASQDPDVYKQYWGTLRDVYNPKKPLPSIRRNEGGMVGASSFKESAEDSTTPDDTAEKLISDDSNSGSSEDSSKTVILHDQALINAIDRLTGVVSKHFSDRSDQMVDSSGSIQAITSLTTAINHMVSTQDHALSRLIELQQQNNKVMEGILQHKLRKASSVKHNLEAVKHDLEAEEVTASS